MQGSLSSNSQGLSYFTLNFPIMNPSILVQTLVPCKIKVAFHMKKLKKEHTKIEVFVSQKCLFLVAFILILH